MMKKNFLKIITLIGLFALTISCNDKIELQQDFDFEVKILPVPSSISPDEQVEIRMEVKSIGGSYDSTRYFMRYFQFEGKGSLSDENGTVFLPNDSYSVSKKPFRYYFNPSSGNNHRFTLYFSDSFEHEHSLDFNFSIINDSIN